MRVFTRLRVYATAAVAVVLFFGWQQRSSSPFRDTVPMQTETEWWKQSPGRLVVFGDDWSDTGQYRTAEPPRQSTRDRSPAQGEVWVETLCKELTCDFIDNFARSAPFSAWLQAVGSMVDSDILADAKGDAKTETLAVFDFKTQVQQFIAFDQKKWRLLGRRTGSDAWTVFTVFFGTWDMLQYYRLEKDAAMRAIDRSVQQLFYNLDILADHVGAPIKVATPRIMDVTLLPRFASQKNESATMFPQSQHQAVFLSTYWNTVLSQAAAKWDKGDLYLVNVFDIVLNEIRAKQLWAKQITDHAGYGSLAPQFDEVEEPCLAPKTDANADDLQAAEAHMCSDPDAHLFWDDFHLGGRAHQIIGKQAARLVRGNETANAHETNGKKGKPKPASFDLKFPPGY